MSEPLSVAFSLSNVVFTSVHPLTGKKTKLLQFFSFVLQKIIKELEKDRRNFEKLSNAKHTEMQITFSIYFLLFPSIFSFRLFFFSFSDPRNIIEIVGKRKR